jgi:chitinase
MFALRLLLAAVLSAVCSANSFTYPIVGAYFPNWAQYRASPATFTPQSMSPIVSTINAIWYGFAYFCPTSDMIQPYWVTQLHLCQGKQPFDVVSIEPKDPQFYQQMIAFKNTNKDLKVLISIGGWNFPSNFWSGMVSTSANRQAFISSIKAFMSQYRFDGVDLDWEFPNSPARTDEVKITCYDFDKTEDAGGSEQDGANLLDLVKEMRQAFGTDYLISFAAQADPTKAGYQKLSEMAQYIDLYNLMSYDYSVSDITGEGAEITAPNEPLYPPGGIVPQQDSVSGTINYYLKNGVAANKMAIGVAYYGHMWYVPGKSGTEWQQYGLTGQVQGQCCGPFAQTLGAKYGKYSQLCGTYMYSEIVAAGFDTMFHNATQTDLGYAVSPKDGYTQAGTWISYIGPDSMKAIVDFAVDRKLAGAFAFDISMDTQSGSSFTFELTKELAQLESKWERAHGRQNK